MKKNLITILVAFVILVIIALCVFLLENYTGISSQSVIFIIGAVLCSAYLIGLIVFFILNKRKAVVKIVEFNAPDNMTPADAGYVIDKKVDDRDISALLIYWADREYLEVREIDKKTIILKKNKDADDKMKDYEKMMFNTIFSTANEVNLKDLPNLIKPIATNIKTQIKNENHKKYFSPKVESVSMWFTLGITLTLIFLSYFFGNGGTPSIVLGILIFLISTFFSSVANKVYLQKKLKMVVLYIIGIVLFLILAALNIVFSINNLYVTILIAIVTLLCLLTYILCPFMEYRNKEGKIVIGQLLGLKEYLELAERERIEALINENPKHFYDVIPFAYVLNVSNKWIEKYNFAKTISKKERHELALAIGMLATILIFGEGASIFGGLFSSSSKKKKKKS